MATTFKSTQITNAEASPVVLNNAAISGCKSISEVALASVLSGDSILSTYRFFRIPSNAVIETISAWSDDLDGNTSCLFNVGLAETAANGSTVVASTLFGSNLTNFQTANTTPVSLRYSTTALNTCTQRVWELLSKTSDTNRDYELIMTLNNVSGSPTTGNVVMRTTYTVA